MRRFWAWLSRLFRRNAWDTRENDEWDEKF